MSVLTRRRFLSIAAASAATPALALDAPVAMWKGRAMGAAVSMKLAGLDADAAAPVFAAVEQELVRLENIFSLYRTESQISRLNRDGGLKAPAPELLQVLSLSDRLHGASGGVFDPTIQPLWIAMAQGETGQKLDAARKLVGWDGVQFDTASVTLREKGQALTLNGIAQGFITDQIAALLKRHGMRDVLLDMGEVTALGSAPQGRDWKVGVIDANAQIVKRLQLRDRALSTSAPMGTALGEAGHILGPQGQAAQHELISVSAPNAAVADGLSTALCLVDAATGAALVDAFKGATLEVSA